MFARVLHPMPVCRGGLLRVAGVAGLVAIGVFADGNTFSDDECPPSTDCCVVLYKGRRAPNALP